MDSGGIVVDIGTIAQYGSISLRLSQNLNDGFVIGIGEGATSPAGVPTGSLTSTILLAGASIAFGWAAARNLRRPDREGGSA